MTVRPIEFAAILMIVVLTIAPGSARASEVIVSKKADRIFFNLASYKLPSSLRPRMEAFVAAGDLRSAAELASSQITFLEVTVRHWASRMANREMTPHGPLNDFVAMIIGSTRDGRDARELLYENFTYLANPAAVTANGTATFVAGQVRAHSSENNRHYEDLERLPNWAMLLLRVTPQYPNGVRAGLSSANPAVAPHTVSSEDTAGLLTSRAFLAAHTDAGTNRRIVQFALRHFTGRELDQYFDPFAFSHRIGRDIDRFPGGDNTLFERNCRGCHSGMDAFRGAFAPWISLVNEALHFPGTVAGKYNANNVFAGGHVTRDTSWENLWTTRHNASVGWDPTKPLSGNGARSFGEMLAYTQAFPRAWARSVFEQVCHRKPMESEDGDIEALAQAFENSGFDLKRLFEEAAILTSCTGI